MKATPTGSGTEQPSDMGRRRLNLGVLLFSPAGILFGYFGLIALAVALGEPMLSISLMLWSIVLSPVALGALGGWNAPERFRARTVLLSALLIGAAWGFLGTVIVPGALQFGRIVDGDGVDAPVELSLLAYIKLWGCFALVASAVNFFLLDLGLIVGRWMLRKSSAATLDVPQPPFTSVPRRTPGRF